MVATKQANMKRRNAGAQGNNNNNRRFKTSIANGVDKRFSNRAGIGAMFNPSQMPDNPGYVDFNEPPPARIPSPVKNNLKTATTTNNKNRISRRIIQPNMKYIAQRNQNTNGWIPPRLPPGQIQNQRPIISAPPVGRNFRNNPMPRVSRHMPPPIGIRPPIPPPPPPPNMNTRFGPRPLLPLPPVAGCAMGPPPPPVGPSRQQMRGVGGPIPTPALLSRGVNVPNVGVPIRRGKNMTNNRRNLRNRKRNGGNIGPNSAKGKKSTSTKKTLSEIVNQYPIDKPWVTDEIRVEHKKKEEIENKLKGNKDDKLFAEFKIQRDKFVTMYEAARLEYIGKRDPKVKSNLEKTTTS